MKVAYIVELDAYQTSGVLNKITSQINTWNSLSIDAKLFLVSKPIAKHMDYAPGVNKNSTWVYTNSVLNFITKLTGKKQVYLNKIFSWFAIMQALKDFAPDIIYYRWGIWFPGQLSRFGRLPVVVELNTNDEDEFKRYNSLTQTIHSLTRGRLLKRADGFCSVTEEIDRVIALKHAPRLVIANAIDTKDIQQRKISKNNKTQLIFVGASDCSWHGVDKIICLAKVMQQYDFHIVGLEKKGDDLELDNVIYHGFLEKNQLSHLYNEMDIGLGTLALHRKNMEEASPLKVREYVANGLPVIVGYLDTDLKDEPYILNIGNYERNVEDNIEKIAEFIETWKNKIICCDLNLIDMTKKEKQRLDFFSSILE